MSNIPRSQPETTTIRFAYQSAYTEIVGDSYVSLSMYFVEHWLPKISATGLKILVQLRSMGFYNPKKRIRRGDIDIEQKDLARLLGVNVRTIQRTFADDLVLSMYVQREFKVERQRGRIVKEHYVYVVTMDDVMTPEDQVRFDLMVQEPDKPKRQNVASVDEPKRHFVDSDANSVAPERQNVAPTRQNVTPYNKVIHTPNTKENTSDTPVADADLSASLFSEQKDRKVPDNAAPPAEPQGDAPADWAYKQARKELSGQGAAAFRAQHGRISEQADWAAYARVLEAEVALRTEIESYSECGQTQARAAMLAAEEHKALLPNPEIAVVDMKIEALTVLRDNLVRLAPEQKDAGN